MRLRFEANQRGIDEIGHGTDLARFVDKLSSRVLDKARSDGHIDDAYRASLDRSPAAPTPNGTAAKVYSTSPFWHLFEFGSINNPAYRVLTRAVTDTGLKFEEH